MLRRFGTQLFTLFLFVAACVSGSAQTTAAQRAGGKGQSAGSQRAFATELIESAIESTRALSPESRVIADWQLVQVLLRNDPRMQVELLRDAFQASRSISRSPEIRSELQSRVLIRLYEIDREAAIQLLPTADSSVGHALQVKEFNRAVESKSFPAALKMVDEFANQPRFPYPDATRLMRSIPRELEAERPRIFAAAVKSFRIGELHRLPRYEDLATWIVRFGQIIPKELTMEAINVVLDDAKDQDKANAMAMSVGTPKGHAEFSSAYMYRLFQLLPTLRKLDDSRAHALLESNPRLAEVLRSYPDGLGSFTDGYTASGEKLPALAITYSKTLANGATPPGSETISNSESIRQAVEQAKTDF